MNYEAREPMPATISIRALVFSNIAFWIALVSGIILVSVLYAGATIASGSATFDQMITSPALIGAWMLVGSVIAPLLAGYVAAKIAPSAKLLHGVLSTSTWLVLSLYIDLFTDNSGDIPRWLDLLASYWVVVPALMGALIWQLRATRISLVAHA